MSHIITFDENSRIIRAKILDSSSTTGAGKTGLAYNTSGLIISTIASSEAAATTYTSAASNIETIATLGTYVAPTSGKCRFKEIDATNHPGLYEIQLADARYSVAGSKDLIVSLLGASGMVPCDVHIPLTAFDLQDADPQVDLINAPNATALNAIADAILKRDWSSVSSEASRSVLNALRFLRNKWTVGTGTLTVCKEDDSTTAWTGAVSSSPGADPITGNDPT